MTSRIRLSFALATCLAAGAAFPLARAAKDPAVRRFAATYVGTIAPPPAGTKRLDVWLPVPTDGPLQTVSDVRVDTPSPSTLGRDSNGNAVAHFAIEDPAFKDDLTVRVTARVERREALGREEPATAASVPASLLAANALVPLTPRVRALAAQVAGDAQDPVQKARRLYDYLVDNGTYDKTTPGWGRGDSERFCDLKKGNCTDFHSAFMALARSQGIPVRFVIGFPLKPEKEGTVPGYHCWASFFAPNVGWVPVDASDAAKLKDPAKKAYLFGNLDPDRFEITRGRDLTLSPPQKDGPLNLFIYPYVEADGKPFTETRIRLEYRDL